MKPIQLREHIRPMYLALMLLMLAPLSVISVLMILLPLLVISMGIHFHEKNLGVVGLLFFYVFGITQLQVASIDHIIQLSVYSILVLIPGLMVTTQILTLGNALGVNKSVFSRKKQLGILLMLMICFLLIIYVLVQYLGLGLLFHIRSVQEQVLLIASISLLLFLPMLLKNTEIEDSAQTEH